MAKKFVYRWRDGVKHRQKSFPSRAHMQAFKDRLARGENIPSEVSFSDFVDKWLCEYSDVMRGPSTRLKDRRIVETYLKPAFGSLKLSSLKKPHIIELRSELSKRPGRTCDSTLSAKTINDIVGVAQTIMACAAEWGYLIDSPFKGIRKIPHTPKPTEFWSIEEKERFLNHCRSRDPMLAEFVLVACETGMRRGELQALQRYQLDFKNRVIRVDATYSEHLKQRLTRTKNKEVGYIPMINAVYDTLKDRQFLSSNAYIFSRKLFPDLYDRFQRRCKEFGMRPIRIHDLRHTFASTRVMAGVSLYSVQRLMRHKCADMTQRYAHLAPDFLKDEAEKGCTRFVRVEGGENTHVSEIIDKTMATPERLELLTGNFRKTM